jgi:TPR repeat protein
LANAYRNGEGVTKDNEQALKWYREVAKNGPRGLVNERIIRELTESVKQKGKDTGQ